VTASSDRVVRTAAVMRVYILKENLAVSDDGKTSARLNIWIENT
jgi:hypothetical protein